MLSLSVGRMVGIVCTGGLVIVASCRLIFWLFVDVVEAVDFFSVDGLEGILMMVSDIVLW